MEEYKIQVLIIQCVIGAVLVVLIACIIYLFYWVRKLQKIVNALDPMSKYKKVGSSLYIKKPQRDTTSISSSFKLFNTNPTKSTYSNGGSVSERENPMGENDVGTLDRNFFTRNDYSFDNQLSTENNTLEENRIEDLKNQRSKTSESETLEALSKLDRVLY